MISSLRKAMSVLASYSKRSVGRRQKDELMTWFAIDAGRNQPKQLKVYANGLYIYSSECFTAKAVTMILIFINRSPPAQIKHMISTEK